LARLLPDPAPRLRLSFHRPRPRHRSPGRSFAPPSCARKDEDPLPGHRRPHSRPDIRVRVPRHKTAEITQQFPKDANKLRFIPDWRKTAIDTVPTSGQG